MRIALITDSHAGARGDSLVFQNYFNKFYYEVFFPYLDKHLIKNIIHLGDIVDKRKGIGYISGHHLNQFMKACDDREIVLDVITGNHDIPLKESLEYNAMSVLYSHTKYNINYYDKPTDVDFDGTTLTMMPWICKNNYQECMDHIKNTKSQILLGHLDIQGFDMYRGMPNQHGMKPEVFNKFDLVFSGHFHHKSTKGNITYLGSPFEITWGDWNDPRGFHIFDTTTRELEYIKNPFLMFHKISYSEDNHDHLMNNIDKYKDSYIKVIVESKDSKQFDEFFTALEKQGVHDLQVIEDLAMDRNNQSIEIKDVEDTRELLNSYVEQVETKVDKTKLTSLMGELYNEALNDNI